MKKDCLHIESIATPTVLINMDKLEKNIAEMKQVANEAGVRLRPHTKVHESPYIAKLQIEAGACGIQVETVERAKCMIDEGINDILIAHPFYDPIKIEMLKYYFTKTNVNITLVEDMIEQAEQINELGKQINKKIPLLLKIALSDKRTRFGIPSGKPVLELSKKILQLPHVQFKGIYAHESGAKPTEEGVEKAPFDSVAIMEEMALLLKREGINI